MDTVAWYLATFKMSQSSEHQATLAAAYDLTHTILRPHPASPVPLIADSIHISLLELTKIFNNSVLSEPSISSEENEDKLVDPSIVPRWYDLQG